jgi:hypothetical protein
LAEARRIADQPEGRHALLLKPDYVSTLFPTQQHARDIVHLLSLDATLLAQDHKLDRALDSIRAMVNVGRSLGDEPTFLSQHIRFACRTEAIHGLERVLAQGEPSEKTLAAVQQVLMEEDAFPTFLIAARGERACLNMLMENLVSGKVATEEVLPELISSKYGHDTKQPEIALDALALKSAHTWMLRWMNEFVEVGKLPSWQRTPRLRQLEKRVKEDGPDLARLLIPGVVMASEADQRSQARVRCAIGALAAERYRREHGLWPDRPHELEGKQLANLPLDPFDGQPMKSIFLMMEVDGPQPPEFFSIGHDGQGIDAFRARMYPSAPRVDIRFRLWHVSQRRQPPP